MSTQIQELKHQQLRMKRDKIQKKIRKSQKQREKRVNDIEKWVKRMEQRVYKDHSRTIRSNHQDNKKMTSFAIHDKNRKLIVELQDKARRDGFFLSKENIINMGLQSLHNDVSTRGVSIHDLFMKYK